MKKTISILLTFALLLSVTVIGVCAADGAPIVTGSGSFTVEEAAQRALDYQEVQNIAGKHEYYHTALMHQEELDNIWAKDHEITWKNNTQYYVGYENVHGFYVTDLQSHVDQCLRAANTIDPSIEISEENEGTGMLWYHMLMSPVIEVAGDGETARGIWMSFGTVTEPNGGSMGAQWTLESYGMDFVKEDGDWKLWHLRTYVYFYCSVDGHWYNISDNTAASGDASGGAPTGVGVIYDENGNQISGAGAEGGPGSGPVDFSTLSEEELAAMGVTPEMAAADPAASMTVPAETGTFFTGYSIYKIPEAPEIPEPYQTWADLTTSY